MFRTLKRTVKDWTDPVRESAYLRASCRRFRVPADQPLILISQVQRSGGTMLSQLIDGHPQVHAHPHELKIGKPKYLWPDFDPGAPPARIFKQIFEPFTQTFLENGYSKDLKTRTGDNREHFRALFLPSIMKRLFVHEVRSLETRTRGTVISAYFTAYFNAWLDNRNLFGEKKYVTGFTAALSLFPASIDRFFEDFPGGYLLSTVRDPVSWYASASIFRPQEYGDLEAATAFWMESAEAAMRHADKYPSRVLIFKFEDLVSNTGDVMRRLCAEVGLDFDPILLRPTFNLRDIGANTSFNRDQSGGIMQEVVQRSNATDPAKAERIREMTGAVYAEILESYVLPGTTS